MADLSPSRVLGADGAAVAAAMSAALAWLDERGTDELLARVGTRVDGLPEAAFPDKSALQDSYGGSQSGPTDDLLAGRGMFYLTEQHRLYLDCTSGHYQMTWGYNDPALLAAAAEAVEIGIVWDNHCNLPQAPVKALARRLVELANPGGAGLLDTVHLGCCTGSVACATALKIQLLCYRRRVAGGAKVSPSGSGRLWTDDNAPAIIVLDGNYHGTDVLAQYLRGMWPDYVRNLEVVAVQPNDADELSAAFDRLGPRAAGFWAEPIMMNREAIVLDPTYLALARRLCDASGALMAIDEIQTGFWQPEVFMFRAMGVVPDLVIAGKGMTAGFHPLAAVIYRGELDVLAQYDAISTNGSAPLPAFVALCCLARIADDAARFSAVGDRFETGCRHLASEFPSVLVDARGRRHMMGLKFRKVEQAIDFHRRAVAAGLWVRVHAYHEGHSTVLTKLSLAADEAVVDFVLGKFRFLLHG